MKNGPHEPAAAAALPGEARRLQALPWQALAALAPYYRDHFDLRQAFAADAGRFERL